MSLTLVPKAGMVLIRPIASKRPQAGSIVLADYYQEPDTTGQIVKLGDPLGCVDCGTPQRDVALGDVVLFPPSAGEELEWQGERYLLLRESEIIATVEEATV